MRTRSQDVKCVLCNGNHFANYKACKVYKKLPKDMFPALTKKIIISSIPSAGKPAAV